MRWTNVFTSNRQKWRRLLVESAPYVIIGVTLVILVPLTSTFLQNIVTEILIYAIFAMSLNLLFGYTGLFSLGHAAFFGVGGYTTGILMRHLGVNSFWLTAPASIFMAVFVAAIFGIIALRVRGLYFLFVTLALGQLLNNIAERWRSMTGGSSGLIISTPNLNFPGLTMTVTSFYCLVLIIFIVCLFLLYRLVNSPFGQVLQGIRDDEGRAAHLGYNTWLFKYIAFILAGAFAGMAGTLFGYFSGIMMPEHLGITTSTIVMLMVIIGSTRVVFGPAIGAAGIILLEHISSIYFPERWPLILGGVFVIAVMFLRGGITIYLIHLWEKIRLRLVNGST